MGLKKRLNWLAKTALFERGEGREFAIPLTQTHFSVPFIQKRTHYCMCLYPVSVNKNVHEYISPKLCLTLEIQSKYFRIGECVGICQTTVLGYTVCIPQTTGKNFFYDYSKLFLLVKYVFCDSSLEPLQLDSSNELS